MQKFTQSQIFLTQSQFLGSFFDAKFIFDANKFQNRINFSTSSIFTHTQKAHRNALFVFCLKLFEVVNNVKQLSNYVKPCQTMSNYVKQSQTMSYMVSIGIMGIILIGCYFLAGC